MSMSCNFPATAALSVFGFLAAMGLSVHGVRSAPSLQRSGDHINEIIWTYFARSSRLATSSRRARSTVTLSVMSSTSGMR